MNNRMWALGKYTKNDNQRQNKKSPIIYFFSDDFWLRCPVIQKQKISQKGVYLLTPLFYRIF